MGLAPIPNGGLASSNALRSATFGPNSVANYRIAKPLVFLVLYYATTLTTVQIGYAI